MTNGRAMDLGGEAGEGAPRSTVPVPSVDRSPTLLFLLPLLSLIAGSCDTIGFIGLGGLFTAHITGNIVLLVAHMAAGADAPLSYLLSVPVFIGALVATRLLVAALERLGVASLRPLLLLQFLLLAAQLALCITALPFDPNAGSALYGGMVGVSAMAVQNALVQVAIRNAPTTAVMTTNTTRFAMDLGDILTARDRGQAAKAAERARLILPSIIAFVVGCVFGAICQVFAGLWSLALPTALGLVAVMIGLATRLDGKA